MGQDFITQFDGTGRAPRDVQKVALQWLSDNWDSRVLIMQMPVGCHEKGHPILLASGDIVAVEDVKVGDLLIGPDGTCREVLSLHRGRQDMATITPHRGRPFRVNLDHILSLEATNSRDIAPGVHNLSVREYLQARPYKQKNLYLYHRGVENFYGPSKDLPIDPYILGIWLADGTAKGVSLTKTKGPLTDAWCKWLTDLGLRIREETKPGNMATTFHGAGQKRHSNAALELLRQIGVSDNKHIPRDYLLADRDSRLRLLTGILDGDGSLTGSGGIDFTQKDKAFADQVVFLARSLGLTAHMSACVKTIKRIGFSGTYYRMYIGGDLSSAPFLRLKPGKFTMKKDQRRVGFNVERSSEDEYYGFEVSGDNLYLDGNFMVHHNSGKSAIAKAVMDHTRGHVITPSNVLINQYTATYPETNFLKGKSHYTCHSSGLSCQEWTNACGQEPCEGCSYTTCKREARTEPTFFNPMSLYYFRMQNPSFWPSVLCVDECHSIASMVLMMTGTRLHKRTYRYTPDCVNELVLSKFLDNHIKGLKKLVAIYKNNTDRLKEVTEELERATLTKQGLDEDPQNYAIWEENKTVRGRRESYLHVRPVRPPKFLMDKLLGADKLILMSGTIFPSDIHDLIGDAPHKFLDLPSPIDKAQRPVYYRPVPFPLNYSTDPAAIVKAVEDVLAKHPGENAIVHVSYGLSEKLRPHFSTPVLFNTSSDKDDVLAKFKKDGGVFLASGCAEGIDLSDDLATVNIIVKLNFPDLTDPTVLKRKAMEDGDDWYSLTTLKTTIQMAGRTTRHEKDKSSTYVLDPNFGRLVARHRKTLPKSFIEAIVWHSQV